MVTHYLSPHRWFRSSRTTAASLGTLTLLAALLLWWSPIEQTLGTGIKIVYLHVALIWTGMLVLVLAGLLGLGAIVLPDARMQQWMRSSGLVGMGFFAASTAVSLLAQKVNWGGIAWFEPRTVAMLRVLAVAGLVQFAGSWPIPARLKGMLYGLLATYLAVSLFGAQLVLHPRNPIGTSTSQAIQFTFYGLFLLSSLAAAWLVMHLQSRGRHPGQSGVD